MKDNGTRTPYPGLPVSNALIVVAPLLLLPVHHISIHHFWLIFPREEQTDGLEETKMNGSVNGPTPNSSSYLNRYRSAHPVIISIVQRSFW